MHAISAAELLSILEEGFGQTPVERALTLLAAACPESTADELAGLSLGQRDALLLALRERTFGPDLAGLADCPACGAKVEVPLNIGDLSSAARMPPPAEMRLAMDGMELSFRLPNSADLLAAAACDDQASRRERLLHRCLLEPRGLLPEPVIAAILEQMSQADPLADIRLSLSCPACNHTWEISLDIVSFLWRELHALSRGLLREVHTIASVYGWRECDILSLSPARRKTYVEMICE